jgi:hypothetical protein
MKTGMDDFLQILLYITIGIVGLLITAYRNKQRRREQVNRFPRDVDAASERDMRPDLGPLAEIFGFPETAIPKPEQSSVTGEPVIPEVFTPEAEGHGVGEEGFSADLHDAEIVQAMDDMKQKNPEAENINYEGIPAFQSTKEALISDSITDTAIEDTEGIYESIHVTEIKGEEDDKKGIVNEAINWRKAVIYSEILQRRGI